MKYLLIILIVTLSTCNSIKKINTESIENYISLCIKNDLNQDTTLCPYFEKEKLEQKAAFYQAELAYFPIKEIKEILYTYLDKKIVSQKDTFGIILYYPFVGFEPESGYETSYLLYGPSLGKEAIIGNYNDTMQTFSKNKITSYQVEQNIKKFQELENACGTGYFIYFYSSLDLKYQACSCAYDLGI